MDAESAALLYNLARAISATKGRFAAPEVLDNLQRAFQYYLDIGDVARAVQVAEYPVDQMASAALGLGLSDFISRALTLVPPDSQQEGRLLSTYALALYQETGDYEEAQEAFNRALTIARREGDLALEIRVLVAAGEAAWWHLSLAEAVEYPRQGVELSGQVDDPWAECQALYHLARAATAMGDAPTVRLNMPALLAAAERVRDRPRMGEAIARNAEICFFTGDWDAALDWCDRGLVLGGSSNFALMRSIRSMLEYERGDFAEGWAHMEQVLGFASRASADLAGFV